MFILKKHRQPNGCEIDRLLITKIIKLYKEIKNERGCMVTPILVEVAAWITTWPTLFYCGGHVAAFHQDKGDPTTIPLLLGGGPCGHLSFFFKCFIND
jgi:hypothetical protein